MTYKQIEASREARLWIGQVIIPAVTCAAIAMSNPNVREFTSDKFQKIKSKVKTITKREKDSV